MTLGIVGLLAGLLLAAVFVSAGIAKLTDLAGTRTAVTEFGVPDKLAPARKPATAAGGET